ncbi:MAG: hypothetical protein LAQ69_42180 [Acidobacteriia bacterium]|nr:hypothetical protein [Terriglobia bacterium]
MNWRHVVRVESVAVASALYLSVLAFPLYSQRVITTAAGTDKVFPTSALPPLSTSFHPVNSPVSNGDIYFIDSSANSILRVTSLGQLRLVAGNGFAAYSGDGGPAVNASLLNPTAIAVDSSGNLYIADYGSERIRKVDRNGIITTVAGNGDYQWSGDGGPATKAGMDPLGVAVDAAGNLYISDYYNRRIRKVTPDGGISTIAGNGNYQSAGDNSPAVQAAINCDQYMAVDPQGNVYFFDVNSYTVRKVSTTGIITRFAGNGFFDFPSQSGIAALNSGLTYPAGLAADNSGNVYITEYNVIRKVNAQGVISILAGNSSFGSSGDGGPAVNATLHYPDGVGVDAFGAVVISDSGNNKIRRVDINGTISTVAGNGGAAFSGDGARAEISLLASPESVALDKQGNLYIADNQNSRIRKVTPQGIISTFAGTGVPGDTGDTGLATAATITDPWGIALDPAGNLYIAEYEGCRVRKVGVNGMITTVAGQGPSTQPGTRGACASDGDGGPATKANLRGPIDMAADGAGNVYIAEPLESRIRKIAPDGRISTLAGVDGTPGYNGDNIAASRAYLNYPFRIAVDGSGNLYVADQSNHRVRKIDTSGTITTVAGNGTQGFSGDNGPAVQAKLDYPSAVAVDNNGTVYIASGARIRQVTRDGTISTIAGNGSSLLSGDGGIATNAGLSALGMVVDAAGNLYIADPDNNRVRLVSIAAPVFTVSPNTLSLSAKSGGAPISAATISVTTLLSGVASAGLSFSATASGINGLDVTPKTGILPQTLQVTLDPSNLSPGSYTGTVTITAPGSVPPTRTVTVTLQVGQPDVPNFRTDTASISVSVPQGALASTSQINVYNSGGGALAFAVAAKANNGGNWLKVTPPGGTASAAIGVALTVQMDPSQLAPGTYTGSIVLTASGTSNLSTTIPVSVAVTKRHNVLVISQTGLSFHAVAGGGQPLNQTFGVLDIGQGSMDWTAQASAPDGSAIRWLSLTPTSGHVTQAYLDVSLATVSVDQSSLAPGEYYGQIQVRSSGADNSPQTMTVYLKVEPAGSTIGPELQPSGLIFTGLQGSSPSSQTVRAASRAASGLKYGSGSVTLDAGNWLNYSPRVSTILPTQPGVITVQPDYTSLGSGAYRGVLTFLFDDGSIRTVSVLTVVAPPGGGAETLSARAVPRATTSCTGLLTVQLTSLQPGAGGTQVPATLGQANSLEAKVTTACTGTPFTSNGATNHVKAIFGPQAERNVELSHIGQGVWQGTWVPNPNDPASFPMQIAATGVQGGQAYSGQSDTYTMALGSGAKSPLVQPGGVKNAADYVSDVPIAPGTFVSIFGDNLGDSPTVASTVPLPTSLGGTTVMLGDRALPLLYVGKNQINVQFPYDLPLDVQHQLLVRRQTGEQSVGQPVSYAAVQPAVYSQDSTGTGLGAVQDFKTGRLNSTAQPARAADVLIVYCTGLGTVSPPVALGGVATGPTPTDQPATVNIGGKSAQVLYSGLTPNYVGLYQINIIMPSGVPAGDHTPLTISIGGQTSPPVELVTR